MAPGAPFGTDSKRSQFQYVANTRLDFPFLVKRQRIFIVYRIQDSLSRKKCGKMKSRTFSRMKNVEGNL
jgi:hypothetical protein